jgi:hypothetical protein
MYLTFQMDGLFGYCVKACRIDGGEEGRSIHFGTAFSACPQFFPGRRVVLPGTRSRTGIG